ncbi:probable 28S ribosomal protein S16, mitochondrial [Nilaparvata lugens]|uniref:probable 28S ribosomal protein S16, mitochondrial n=1 Tax=Nilaparvata lugens TaxID=108931 RepID=UPI000B991A5A|nr:probable 28S ribosomal protein S16, mitochondrial [Nilaparvata lugens]
MRVKYPFPKLFPASGGGKNVPHAEKAIRFIRYGCANRPFYHIVVSMAHRSERDHPIEQLGSYDPLPNKYNEKLVALNVERILYWIGEGASLSKPIAQLLGLSGLMPVYPLTYLRAQINRRQSAEIAEKLKTATETAERNKAEAAQSS